VFRPEHVCAEAGSPQCNRPNQIHCQGLGYTQHVTDCRFGFRFTMPYRFAAFRSESRLRRARSGANGTASTSRFGLWRVETSLDNIADVAITGLYTFVKTAGPAHLSLTELTFATNGDRGRSRRCRPR